MKKEGTAYILGEENISTIAEKTGIEEGVLRTWLLYDRSFGLQSKVIVVEITPEEKT